LLTWFDENTTSCPVIAEVAQSHDGSLGAAYAYVDAVARAGAAAIKFQTHIAAAESSVDEPWRVKFSRQDETRFDYWKRIEFAPDQWRGLAAYAREKGLIFLSSAFSLEAVDLLDSIGVPAWKVGAGEVTNLPMLERMARTGKPVLLSSGMSGWGDLDRAVSCVRQAGSPVAVFQCTTAYPCPPEQLGLNVLGELRRRYECPVGLSDHSGTIYAGLAAAALGANMLEVHVTFSRECFGPDVPASITTGELKELVQGVLFIRRALENPVDKEGMAEKLSEMRTIFGKSLVASRALETGTRVSEADFLAKKPGTGIPVARIKEFAQRRLRRSVAAGQRFAEEDFE
jgi:N-acetylneuraminate synthase